MLPEIYDFLMLRLRNLNLSQLHLSFVTGILMTKLTITLESSIQTLKALEHELDLIIDVKEMVVKKALNSQKPLRLRIMAAEYMNEF